MSVLSELSAMLRDEDEHYAVLTGLRGCAALWVFAYHTWALGGMPQLAWNVRGATIDLTPPIALGGAGVTVFFVLSGFLLSLPFARWQAGIGAKPLFSRYLFRRIARVFPAYYAQLAILLLIAPLGTGLASLPDGAVLWRHLLMLFVPPPIGTSPINGVWWTLPIEFSFYLLLPFLAALLRGNRWWWLVLGAMGAMWIWRHGVVTHFSDAPLPLRVSASYQLAGSFDMFGLGMFAAVAHCHWNCLPPRLHVWIATRWAAFVGIAVLVVASYWLAHNRPSYWADNAIFYLWTPLLSLGTVVLILGGLHGNAVLARLFGHPMIVFSGVVSYSVYLWHLPVLHALVPVAEQLETGIWRLVVLAVAAVVCTFVISTISYLLVERPVIQLAHRRLRSQIA